eukprot:COSAG02_NODE_35092_length_474_cov_0.565333_1_plen_56_part_10
MCNELQVRLRNTQSQVDMSTAGHDEAVQQLEKRLDIANREATNARELVENLRNSEL